jgi:hypothetical protein
MQTPAPCITAGNPLLVVDERALLVLGVFQEAVMRFALQDNACLAE